MNKEEKRKMKTLELNSKEDFQYYLYQLICRSYKLIRQQDIYLLRLSVSSCTFCFKRKLSAYSKHTLTQKILLLFFIIPRYHEWHNIFYIIFCQLITYIAALLKKFI